MAPVTHPNAGLGEKAARVVMPIRYTAEHAPRLLARDGGSGCSGLNITSGALAGIIIGTIAGTLLVLWIIRSCITPGAPPRIDRDPMYKEAPAMRTRHHSRRHSNSGHSGHRRRSYSVDSSAPPPVVIRDTSRRSHRQQPTHVFGGNERGRTYV